MQIIRPDSPARSWYAWALLMLAGACTSGEADVPASVQVPPPTSMVQPEATATTLASELTVPDLDYDFRATTSVEWEVSGDPADASKRTVEVTEEIDGFEAAYSAVRRFRDGELTSSGELTVLGEEAWERGPGKPWVKIEDFEPSEPSIFGLTPEYAPAFYGALSMLSWETETRNGYATRRYDVPPDSLLVVLDAFETVDLAEHPDAVHEGTMSVWIDVATNRLIAFEVDYSGSAGVLLEAPDDYPEEATVHFVGSFDFYDLDDPTIVVERPIVPASELPGFFRYTNSRFGASWLVPNDWSVLSDDAIDLAAKDFTEFASVNATEFGFALGGVPEIPADYTVGAYAETARVEVTLADGRPALLVRLAADTEPAALVMVLTYDGDWLYDFKVFAGSIERAAELAEVLTDSVEIAGVPELIQA